MNELGNNVNDGWIIILDDDSKLIDNTFLEKLADECSKSTPKEILIFQSLLLPKKVLIPSNKNFDITNKTKLNEYINKFEHINRIIEINIQNRRFTLCASSIARFIRLHSFAP